MLNTHKQGIPFQLDIECRKKNLPMSYNFLVSMKYSWLGHFSTHNNQADNLSTLNIQMQGILALLDIGCMMKNLPMNYNFPVSMKYSWLDL